MAITHRNQNSENTGIKGNYLARTMEVCQHCTTQERRVQSAHLSAPFVNVSWSPPPSRHPSTFEKGHWHHGTRNHRSPASANAGSSGPSASTPKIPRWRFYPSKLWCWLSTWGSGSILRLSILVSTLLRIWEALRFAHGGLVYGSRGTTTQHAIPSCCSLACTQCSCRQLIGTTGSPLTTLGLCCPGCGLQQKR